MVPHLGVDGLVKFLSRWGETVDTVNFMSMRGVGRAGGGSRPRAGGPGADQKMRPRARAPPIGGQLRPPCPPSLTLSTEARAAALSVSAGAANAEVAARARTRKATRMVEEGVSVRGLVFFFFLESLCHSSREPTLPSAPPTLFFFGRPPCGPGEGQAFSFTLSSCPCPVANPAGRAGAARGVGREEGKKTGRGCGGAPSQPLAPPFFALSFLSLSKRGSPHHAYGGCTPRYWF